MQLNVQIIIAAAGLSTLAIADCLMKGAGSTSSSVSYFIQLIFMTDTLSVVASKLSTAVVFLFINLISKQVALLPF